MRKIYHTYRPQPLWFRNFIRFLIRVAVWLLIDLSVEGEENIPQDEGFLVVGNHFSLVDPVLVVRIIPQNIEFIAGAAPLHAPELLKLFPALWGIIPVNRGNSTKDALRIAEDIVKDGGVVGIFPEGGSWAQVLRPARPGTSFMAARTGAKILPIGIIDGHDVFPNLGKLKRTKVQLKIGKPFGPYDVNGKGRERRKQLDAIGEEIMLKIRDLIPPEQHGCFSDDPAIREAAKGTEIYPWDEKPEGQVEAFGPKI